MLLFISASGAFILGISLFQYISCYSLSPHTRVPSLCTLVSIHLMLLFIPLLFRCSIPCCSFNTSHVTLYRNQKQECSHCITVSIHLMLLFIRSSDTTLNGRKCFNTSHVTLYQKIHFYNRRKRQVSIHLMLLFIGKKCQDELFSERFNTSHVTLYPYDDTYDVVIHWFQYISCYSLSQEDESYDETGIVSIHLMLLFIITPVAEDWDKRLFQYISCYSLSVYVLPLQSAPSFQYISCYSLSSMCITMHNIFLFQYISCYSLSVSVSAFAFFSAVSIHLMLLFI